MKKKFLCFMFLIIGNYLNCIQIKSIYDILKKRQDIEYIKCYEAQNFNYQPFPISQFSERHPNQGTFAETFILRIPKGEVFGGSGVIKIEDIFLNKVFIRILSQDYI